MRYAPAPASHDAPDVGPLPPLDTGPAASRPTTHESGAWSDRAAALAVVAVIAAFVALSALYMHYTPLGQAPDEASHLAYVRLIADHLQLPVAAREHQQPPAYYLAGALLYRLTGSPAAVQWLSVVLGALTLVVVWLTARELQPGRPARQVLPVLLAAAIPQLQFISGAISDDPLSYLSGGLLIFLAVRVWRKPPAAGLCAAVGGAIALAVLSKETDYVYVALLGLVLLVAWRRYGLRRELLLIPGIPVVGAGWWFVRNLSVYHHVLPNLAPVGGAHDKLRHLWQLRQWYDVAVRSAFALFGSMTTSISVAGSQDLLYRLLELVVGLLVVVGLVEVARRWRGWDGRRRLVVAVLAVAVALAVLQMVLNSVFIDYQAQGRYLFVALSAIAIGASFCVWAVCDRLPRALSACVLMLVVGLLASLDGLGVLTVHSQLILVPVPVLR